MSHDLDTKAMHSPEWSVAEAKARFSEVVARAKAGEPQRVTRYGKDEVMVVSVSDWVEHEDPDRKPSSHKGESLFDLFASMRNTGAGDELADILQSIENEGRYQPLDPSLTEA